MIAIDITTDLDEVHGGNDQGTPAAPVEGGTATPAAPETGLGLIHFKDAQGKPTGQGAWANCTLGTGDNAGSYICTPFKATHIPKP